MSIRERFNKAFGLKDSVEEEKGRFVERVKQVIFRQIDTAEWEVFDYPPLFKLVCFELGVNAHDERMAHHYRGQMEVPPELRYLTEND